MATDKKRPGTVSINLAQAGTPTVHGVLSFNDPQQDPSGDGAGTQEDGRQPPSEPGQGATPKVGDDSAPSEEPSSSSALAKTPASAQVAIVSLNERDQSSKKALEQSVLILGVVESIAYSLYVLHEAVSDQKFQALLKQDLPSAITNAIQNTMKSALQKLEGIFSAVDKLQTGEMKGIINNLFDAGLEVAIASTELYEDKKDRDEAQRTVEKLALTLGLVSDCSEYILACVNILQGIMCALAGKAAEVPLSDPTKKLMAELEKQFKPRWDKRRMLRKQDMEKIRLQREPPSGKALNPASAA